MGALEQQPLSPQPDLTAPQVGFWAHLGSRVLHRLREIGLWGVAALVMICLAALGYWVNEKVGSVLDAVVGVSLLVLVVTGLAVVVGLVCRLLRPGA